MNAFNIPDRLRNELVNLAVRHDVQHILKLIPDMSEAEIMGSLNHLRRIDEEADSPE